MQSWDGSAGSARSKQDLPEQALVRSVWRTVGSVIALARQKPRRDSKSGPFWPDKKSIVKGSLIFLAIVFATQALLDLWSISEARNLPHWFVVLSRRISTLGKSSWVLYPVGLLFVLCIFAGLRVARPLDRLIFKSLLARLTFLGLAIALPGLLTMILKPIIGRVRPHLSGQADPFMYAPFEFFREFLFGTMPVPEYAYGSMPSGHAANVVAFAVAFGALWPRAKVVLWTFAVLICMTRLTIIAHHPTDVMVGAAIGGLGAIATRNYFAARRWVFAVDASGRFHAMPGPSAARLKRALLALWNRP